MTMHEDLSRARTEDTSVRADPALFAAVRDAYAWEVATDRTRARSSAEWIEQAVERLAQMSAPARRKVLERHAPTRYMIDSTKRPRNVRLSPAVIAQIEEANRVDREASAALGGAKADTSRHRPSDLIVPALYAAVARSERAAGGTLPPAPDRLPLRSARPPLGKRHVSVTVSAPESFHRALASAHASSEPSSSYVSWLTDTFAAWADLSEDQRAAARSQLSMPTSADDGDVTKRRSYRIVSTVRDQLRPLEARHPRTVVEALAWKLNTRGEPARRLA
ncbi:hypothetical protein [Dermacoccus sp. Tok2021]|uniref:hypothetical protein n=1 Tax=Dermacoccus sp. Tok2021 TaxID=2826873 RepID=UPI001CA7A94D|nr:hypothetical protein [Dermacoccus sp. Tok2021]MBZ4497927.1 hypothetical protein [Dermacoccus sp. Tok2021]